MTSQGFQLTFDVLAGGTSLVNLAFTKVELSAGGCSGAGLGNFSGIGWRLGYYVAQVSASGAFSVDRVFSGSDSDLGPYNVTIHIAGQLSGSSATGTLNLGMTFNYQGVDQNCAANLSWNASM